MEFADVDVTDVDVQSVDAVSAPDREYGPAAVMVYATFPDEASAATVAEALVTAGLVACANLLPGLRSFYIWQGKLEREQEVALVMKTRRALAAEVVAEIRARHPFDNPAVVVLPIIAGSMEYLAWVMLQTERQSDGAVPP